MPECRALVCRTIVQSSGFHVVHSPEAARAAGAHVLDAAGLRAAGAAGLLDLPVERLLHLQATLGERYLQRLIAADYTVHAQMPLQPAVDGVVLVDDPHVLLESHHDAGALMAGCNRDELALTARYWPGFADIDEPRLLARAGRLFEFLGVDGARQAIETYRAAAPGATPGRLWLHMANDAWVNVPARRLRAAHRGATFAYLFGCAPNLDDSGLDAYHGMEIPFVWNTLASAQGRGLVGTITPAAQRVALVTSAAWAQFARDGVPGGAGVPAWKRWRTDSPQVMEIGVEPRLLAGWRDPELQLWDAASFTAPLRGRANR
jgi:para-nitrobenzyl esterase